MHVCVAAMLSLPEFGDGAHLLRAREPVSRDGLVLMVRYQGKPTSHLLERSGCERT